MKKSELKDYIKEQIIDVLSEASSEDVENQKAYNDELEKTADLMSKMDMKEEDVEEANYSNVAVDKSDFAINKYKKASDYKKSYDSLADKRSQDQFDDDVIDKKASKMAGSRKERAKATKQDKIIKDFKSIEAQMKTHLELFKTSESPKNKELAKNMLKKLTPEFQAAKKAYDKIRNVKV